MRKLLFTRESPKLQPIRALIERQRHRTLALWAVDAAGPVLELFERRVPGDPRPREAVEAAIAWMRGEIKMPAAKMAAHAAHHAATAAAYDPAACAAARAMGHVVGTVHVETHAIGVVMYGLTAVAYASSRPEEAGEAVAAECARYYERLRFWETEIDRVKGPWAAFLLNDDAPNKEMLLRKKAKSAKHE